VSGRDEQKARAVLERAARRYKRWGTARASEATRARFERAQRALHKAAERYALTLRPAEQHPGNGDTGLMPEPPGVH
jgi:predicted nucleic acid-binding protein